MLNLGRSIVIVCVLFLALAMAVLADTTVTFIDVGQGDSCWLRLPNGDDVLIDGGKPQAGPTVVAYLQGRGC